MSHRIFCPTSDIIMFSLRSQLSYLSTIMGIEQSSLKRVKLSMLKVIFKKPSYFFKRISNLIACSLWISLILLSLDSFQVKKCCHFRPPTIYSQKMKYYYNAVYRNLPFKNNIFSGIRFQTNRCFSQITITKYFLNAHESISNFKDMSLTFISTLRGSINFLAFT